MYNPAETLKKETLAKGIEGVFSRLGEVGPSALDDEAKGKVLQDMETSRIFDKADPQQFPTSKRVKFYIEDISAYLPLTSAGRKIAQDIKSEFEKCPDDNEKIAFGQKLQEALQSAAEPFAAQFKTLQDERRAKEAKATEPVKTPAPEPAYQGIVLSSVTTKPSLTAAAEAERVANRDKVKPLLEQCGVLDRRANETENTARELGETARKLDAKAFDDKRDAEDALTKVNFVDDATVVFAETQIKTALKTAQDAIDAAREAKATADSEIVDRQEGLRVATEAVSSVSVAHETAVRLGVNDPELAPLVDKAKGAQEHAQKLLGPAETRSVDAQKFLERQEKNLEQLKVMATDTQKLHATGEVQRKAELAAKAARDKADAVGATQADKDAAAAANQLEVEGLLNEAERLRDLAKGLEGTTSGLLSENKQAWEKANRAITSAETELKAAQDAKPAEAKTEPDAKAALEKAELATRQIKVAEKAVGVASSSTYDLKYALEAEKSAKELALAAASKADAQAKSLGVGGDLAAKTEQGLAAAVVSDREAKEAVEKCEQAIEGNRSSSEAVYLMEEEAWRVSGDAAAAVHRLDPAAAVALTKARDTVKKAEEALTVARASLERVRTEAVASVKLLLQPDEEPDSAAHAEARRGAGEMKKAADEVKLRADEVFAATEAVFNLTGPANIAGQAAFSKAWGAQNDAFNKAEEAGEDALSARDLDNVAEVLVYSAELVLEEEEAARTASLKASRPTATPSTVPVVPATPTVPPDESLTAKLKRLTKRAVSLNKSNADPAADPTLLFAEPDANKSSVHSANSKDYSIGQIENFFREAIEKHESEYGHKLGYDITLTKESFTVTKGKGGEQLAVVEKNADKSISYKFPKEKDLGFEMADVVLRSSKEQVLILHSTKLEHIEQILKAAATPPNDTKIKIKLDAATEKFLKEYSDKNEFGPFINLRLEADGFAVKETTSAKEVEDAKKAMEAAARANADAVPALLAANGAWDKAEEKFLKATAGTTAKTEAKEARDEAAEAAKAAKTEADKAAAELKAAEEQLKIATKGASDVKTGVSDIKQDATEAAKVAAEQLKKDIAAKTSTPRRLST